MKILQTLVMVSLATGLSQIANAGTSDTNRMQYRHDYMMKDADANNDGVISREEFMTSHKTRSEKMFTRLDANNDGKIDQSERQSRRGMMHGECMMKDDEMTSDKK